ncbi:MAG: hypothetical protein IIZ09_06330 [Ruminococcus sp.]|nr:hypothetical protein [Ruminococcus sp.]
MKNKIIASVMAVTMVFALTACGETSENTPAQTTTKAAETTLAAEKTEETEAPTETEVPAETEAPTETKVPSDDSEDYFNWFGLNMYLPADYSVMMSEGFPQASKDSADGIENNIVYYTLAKDDLDPMNAETVKDYMYESAVTFDALSAEFKGYFIEDNEVESEEPAQINGGDFIRQAGIYHITDFADKKDVAYVAYFGVMDFPEFGKQPAMIIAFSHHTDDEMKKELARLVDTAAENAAPINK